MHSPTPHRESLSRLRPSGALLAAASGLSSIGDAQTNEPARAVINQAGYRSDLGGCHAAMAANRHRSLTESGTREGGLRRLG